MPIRLICPTCQARLTAPDSAAGMAVRCPKCRAVDRVPVGPDTVARSAEDTAEQPVTLFPSAPGDLVPVRPADPGPPSPAGRFRAGLAWGAGFWLAGLAAAAVAVAARAAFGWVTG